MDLTAWPSILTMLVSGFVALLAWSLRRNVKGNDAAIEALRGDLKSALGSIADKVDAVASSVSSHGTQLAVGAAGIADLARRVDGLEERERERGCYAACPTRAGTPAPR